MDILERFKNYNSNSCWQYNIRQDNIESDLSDFGLTKDFTDKLKVSDFTLHYIPKEDKIMVGEIKNFIKKHEWLGKMSNYPTHYFIAKYKDILCGVVIMDMPNAFSKLLGDETKKIERLISRGACISWSPKNLASSLIMFSIKWMVKNTPYRVFTAYSDPEAKELGTIYQACNFYYLGQKSGANKQYKNEKGSWVSDRYFRSRSVYKRLAKKNNITIKDEWISGDSVLWDKIPDNVEVKLKQLSKEYQNNCEDRIIPKKHKYVYILGRNKIETKILRNRFEEINPKLKNLPYPKLRGK